MVRRKGESPACTHVYLYIGRAKDLRWRKWQGGCGGGVDFRVWVPTKQLHFSAGHKKDKGNDSLDVGSVASHLAVTHWPSSWDQLTSWTWRDWGWRLVTSSLTWNLRGSGVRRCPLLVVCVGVFNLRVQLNTDFITRPKPRPANELCDIHRGRLKKVLCSLLLVFISWYSAGIWWQNDRIPWLYNENVTADFYEADLGEVLNLTKHFPFLEWYVLENKVIDSPTIIQSLSSHSMLMESRMKFHCPQKTFGASQQNNIAAYNLCLGLCRVSCFISLGEYWDAPV